MKFSVFPAMILLLITSFFLPLSCRKTEAAPQAAEVPEVFPTPIHPSFRYTEDDLTELIKDLPDSVQQNIQKRPEYFLELSGKLLELPEDVLILVNKETALTADFEPADLVELEEYKEVLTLSRRGHRLRKYLMPALLAMNEAARQQGLDLMISSCYRSYDYQKGLYERYVATDGREAADRYSARPGTSQHQLGMAMDFGSIDESFAATSEGIWLKKHAREYGFSLSYPVGMEELTGYMWESWHYRYLTPVGTEMEKEFFNGIQEHMLRFFHDKRDALEAARI